LTLSSNFQALDAIGKVAICQTDEDILDISPGSCQITAVAPPTPSSITRSLRGNSVLESSKEYTATILNTIPFHQFSNITSEPSELFNQLSAKLNNSISNGNFTFLLRKNSVLLNASSTALATCLSILTSNFTLQYGLNSSPTPTNSTLITDTRTPFYLFNKPAAILSFITIGSFVVVFVAGFLFWRYLTSFFDEKKKKESPVEISINLEEGFQTWKQEDEEKTDRRASKITESDVNSEDYTVHSDQKSKVPKKISSNQFTCSQNVSMYSIASSANSTVNKFSHSFYEKLAASTLGTRNNYFEDGEIEFQFPDIHTEREYEYEYDSSSDEEALPSSNFNFIPSFTKPSIDLTSCNSNIDDVKGDTFHSLAADSKGEIYVDYDVVYNNAADEFR